MQEMGGGIYELTLGEKGESPGLQRSLKGGGGIKVSHAITHIEPCHNKVTWDREMSLLYPNFVNIRVVKQ